MYTGQQQEIEDLKITEHAFSEIAPNASFQNTKHIDAIMYKDSQQ